jgi:hypothetical protein
MRMEKESFLAKFNAKYHGMYVERLRTTMKNLCKICGLRFLTIDLLNIK